MTDLSRFEHLSVERDGDVVTITMLVRNHATHTELSQVFAQLRADPARVVVLTGTGDSFLGPPNLPEFAKVDAQAWQRLMREARWIVRDALDLPQVLVIALNGDAIGLGASLMSVADVVVAAEGVTLSENHIAMGIAAGDGGTLTLPFLLGIHRAKRFFLLNEPITVEELRELGVVAEVVPRDELPDATRRITARLLELPAPALEWTKASLNRVLQLSMFMGIDAAVGHEGWSWHLDAAQAGVEDLRARFGDEA